jgi:hypothetical protein
MRPLLVGIVLVAVLPCVTGCGLLGGGAKTACTVDPPEMQFLKKGYYAVRGRCEYLYCKNGPLTGSQLVVRQCKSAKELRQNEKDAQDIMNREKEPRPMVCTADGCHPV